VQPKVQLSWNQKIALLFQSPQGSAACAVYWKLKEQEALPALHSSDYHALAGMGLALRAPTWRYHKLTDAGRFEADDVAKQIARERGIHAFYADNSSRYHSSVRCVCGWAAPFTKTNRGMSMDRIRAESAHLRTVGAMKQLANALTTKATG
jgi:hypothetical protein